MAVQPVQHGGLPSPAAGLVVAIFGPTASGKSEVAEALADALKTEVVSADAMQVYRGLPILTNQPNRPTHLVAIRDLDDEMSVGEYAGLAHQIIDELVTTRGTAVVAGGTGLYLRAALAELDPPPPAPPGTRARWEEFYDQHGSVATHAVLHARDPNAAAAVHPNDRRRVVRALELADVGSSLSGPGQQSLWSSETRHRTLLVGIEVEPALLATRIADRTRSMFTRGVLEEARAIPATSETSKHAIGLRELLTLDREEAEEAMNIRTRRYAAYQRKWLRRLEPDLVVDGGLPPEQNTSMILEHVEEQRVMRESDAGR